MRYDERDIRLQLERLEERILLSLAGLDSGYEFLDEQAEQFKQSGDVYAEADAGGNLYAPSGWMNVASGGLQLDPADTGDVGAGQTSMEVSWDGTPGDDGTPWAAVMFEWPRNLAGATSPGPGWDLSGATELTFQAHSDDPGESIMVGLGSEDHDGFALRRRISLQTDWTEYSIDVSDRDLLELNGGFFIAFDGFSDAGDSGVTLHLDEVSYDAVPPGPHLLQSYRPNWGDGDARRTYRNTAYTYDNALAALAYFARGESDQQQAREILDALHWTLQNEQIDPGLEEYIGEGEAFLRSGYRAGPVQDPANGLPREAGWTDSENNWEALDRTILVGNNSWAMIGLLNGYRHLGGAQYLEDAALIGNWIHNHWHDAENGGYEMGLGYEDDVVPWPGHRKSTEYNIDVFAAFSLLADAYEEQGNDAEAAIWRARADDAGQFVMSMQRPSGGFWTGTDSDGITPNDDVHVLDPQSWSVLAFAPRPAWQDQADWHAAMDYAESELGATAPAGAATIEGFDFGRAVGTGGEPDGVWLEGTAQMAAAYGTLGAWAPAEHFLRQLEDAQQNHPNGDGSGLVAAAEDGLTTGFGWAYDARLYVGATAWTMMANENYNPFTASHLDQPRGTDRLGMAIPSWWHDKYEGPAAATALDALAETGADVLELTPTWYQDDLNSDTIYADPFKTASDPGVLAMIQQAHDAGMEVLLKPHLDVHGGRSRTNIDPDNPSLWFDSYAGFITHYADLAEQAGTEYLAVGTELSSMSGPTYLADWQDVIGQVGASYTGRTVYAANHDEYAGVSFWDEVDLIGLDAYFDLGASVPHASPTAEELRTAWEPILDEVTGWLTDNQPDKSVLITEIGYRNIDDAHIRPWESWRDGTPDEATQAACYEAALDAWGERPWMEGILFWTWPNNLAEDIPQGKPDTGYVPYNRMAEAVFTAAAGAGADLLPAITEATPDHVLDGQTTLSYQIENQGSENAPAFAAQVVLSRDEIIGNADDRPVTTLSLAPLPAGDAAAGTVALELDKATLNEWALEDDPTGQGAGHRSTNAEWLGLVVDPENLIEESNEDNNTSQDRGVGKDDITYFPWDIDDSELVTPTDAIYVINRLGEEVPPADGRADPDGSGVVTPTDAIAVINRLGYEMNTGVVEEMPPPPPWSPESAGMLTTVETETGRASLLTESSAAHAPTISRVSVSGKGEEDVSSAHVAELELQRRADRGMSHVTLNEGRWLHEGRGAGGEAREPMALPHCGCFPRSGLLALEAETGDDGVIAIRRGTGAVLG